MAPDIVTVSYKGSHRLIKACGGVKVKILPHLGMEVCDWA